ncbi:cyanovirin-n domain-containing protein [Moelleriella libera RCEF 2490]|uniref:Cyanovirin-n domain-containing protein n=1 Tax=Moelleriella libera RCEF 2490 TaxID=1081109 RepID=A0A162K2X1_9HYPO|nr:cyanovirin-n domain-containing protein [Moelleriella libera RCEF 2490]
MLSTAFLLCSLVVGAVALPAPETTSFLNQCRYISLGGRGKVGQATLAAQCVDIKGRWWDTSINLNMCIGSEAGSLKYIPEGNFDASCRPCVLDTSDHVRLKCNCLNEKGVPRFTALDMGHQGEQNPSFHHAPVNDVHVSEILTRERGV